MPRRAKWGVAIGVAIAVAIFGAGFMLTEGALFSRATYEWRVAVLAGPGQSWSVDVPRLVNGTSVHTFGNESLAAFLSTLSVASGDASFELSEDALRIDGAGPAVVAAERSARRNAGDFVDWRASGASVSRAHELGTIGPIEIVWTVDLSGGRGHSCWAREEHRAVIEAGGSAAFDVASAPTEEQTRLWQTVCA